MIATVIALCALSLFMSAEYLSSRICWRYRATLQHYPNAAAWITLALNAASLVVAAFIPRGFW